MAKTKKMLIIEEIFNAITHGIGTLLGIAAYIILLVFAFKTHNTAKIISVGIFGFTLILMYLTSTLFHCFMFSKAKNIFELLDHSFIYLFIAGTYTPLIVIGLEGSFRYIALISIWIIAACATIITIFNINRQKLSLILYLSLGWFVIFFLKPLSKSLSMKEITFLFIGGILYSVGVIFFVRSKHSFNHLIWHLFVLGGSAFHFAAIFSLIPLTK